MRVALHKFRLQWLDRMFTYIVVVAVLNLTWCVLQYYTVENSELVNLFLAANTILAIVVWGLLKLTRLKKLT